MICVCSHCVPQPRSWNELLLRVMDAQEGRDDLLENLGASARKAESRLALAKSRVHRLETQIREFGSNRFAELLTHAWTEARDEQAAAQRMVGLIWNEIDWIQASAWVRTR